MFRFSSSARLLALLFATALLAACDLGTVTIPRTKPTIVVHAVLNPLGNDQVVLVERTLTGAVNIPDTIFDSSDPILSAGGVPVIDATVEIIDSAGRVTRGIEDRTVTSNKKGSGVYRVPLRGQSIVLGGRYQLRIRTTEGEEVTAFTRVPLPASRATGGLTRTFNRDREALFISWSRANARSYFLRVESPFGPFFLFTDSTALRISGELRNLFAGELQRVFMPGFRQDMYVAAVDSNFFDYYRTNNDPFTGAGIISRVNGGLGMFGSMVNMNTGTITVVADQTEPIEGRFRLVPSSVDPTMPTLFTLYVESPAARPDLPIALSGRYNLGGSTTRGDGLLGRMLGSEVDIVLISNQLAGDTVDVFSGELDGDTLRGTFRRKEVAAVFARIR